MIHKQTALVIGTCQLIRETDDRINKVLHLNHLHVLNNPTQAYLCGEKRKTCNTSKSELSNLSSIRIVYAFFKIKERTKSHGGVFICFCML